MTIFDDNFDENFWWKFFMTILITILMKIFDENFWWKYFLTIFDDNFWWQFLMTIFDDNFFGISRQHFFGFFIDKKNQKQILLISWPFFGFLDDVFYWCKFLDFFGFLYDFWCISGWFFGSAKPYLPKPFPQPYFTKQYFLIAHFPKLYFCETQPPASIGWVALSSVVRLFVVAHR